jgi:AcrR family transcriptional regulator
MTVKQAARPARKRNPRGQGERLRDDIIEAASRLLADPAAPPLTLRAVAREAGIAATSVYLHFEDVESLALAVVDRRFGELIRVQEEALAGDKDPRQRLRDVCLAYCEFGLANPGHYQVMFTTPLPLSESTIYEQRPMYKSFQRLIDAAADCIGAGPGDPEAFFTAHLLWQQMHGIVSLRISRPRFRWPPLADAVTQAADRLLAGARPQTSLKDPFIQNGRGASHRRRRRRLPHRAPRPPSTARSAGLSRAGRPGGWSHRRDSPRRSRCRR